MDKLLPPWTKTLDWSRYRIYFNTVSKQLHLAPVPDWDRSIVDEGCFTD